MGTKILSNELWDRSARHHQLPSRLAAHTHGRPRSFASKHSVSPDESADNIVNIAVNIDEVPGDQMFMTHTGDILPW